MAIGYIVTSKAPVDFCFSNSLSTPQYNTATVKSGQFVNMLKGVVKKS